MSMTREEARIELQAMKDTFEEYEPGGSRCQMALKVALTALRPVSREQVEKVWRGEWNQDELGRVVCNRCGSMAAIGTENALHNAKKYDRFCFYCGAPMTDEAVEMVMERLEALKDG